MISNHVLYSSITLQIYGINRYIVTLELLINVKYYKFLLFSIYNRLKINEVRFSHFGLNRYTFLVSKKAVSFRN